MIFTTEFHSFRRGAAGDRAPSLPVDGPRPRFETGIAHCVRQRSSVGNYLRDDGTFPEGFFRSPRVCQDKESKFFDVVHARAA